MKSIKEFEAINSKQARSLNDVGIYTTQQLLESAASASGRMSLADQTNIDADLILSWANMIDLMRVDGLSYKSSKLLVDSKVTTVPKLAYCDPARLVKKLKLSNEKLKLFVKNLELKKIEKFIINAKTLPKIISH